MWKLGVLKNRQARASATVALAASAGAPDSGLRAIDNSHGSSAAVSELVSSIGSVLDQIDCEEEPGDFLRLQLERLASEALRYRNCRIIDGIGERWTCGPDLSHLLYASCLCSARVYDTEGLGHIQDIEINKVKTISPSFAGTLKATAFWTVKQRSDSPSPPTHLIVSIRGSVRTADHIVNLNDSQRDTSSLFTLGKATLVYAHAGFLNAAKCLLPEVTAELRRQIADNPSLTNIIFTGHSAGGAVASLLFLHHLCDTSIPFSSTRLSLITFGSAPVTRPSITDIARRKPNAGEILAVVNENDMVPRSDGPYIRSLVDLYKSRCTRTSVSNNSTGGTDGMLSQTFHPYTEAREVWLLPEPDYHLVGDIIVLGEPDMLDKDNFNSPDHGNRLGTSITAMKVDMGEFGKLLFCDIEVHRRRAYLERLRLIWEQSCKEPPNTDSRPREWFEDVLSWSGTESSLTDDFCSLFTASTFSTLSTQ